MLSKYFLALPIKKYKARGGTEYCGQTNCDGFVVGGVNVERDGHERALLHTTHVRNAACPLVDIVIAVNGGGKRGCWESPVQKM